MTTRYMTTVLQRPALYSSSALFFYSYAAAKCVTVAVHYLEKMMFNVYLRVKRDLNHLPGD